MPDDPEDLLTGALEPLDAAVGRQHRGDEAVADDIRSLMVDAGGFDLVATKDLPGEGVGMHSDVVHAHQP